MLGLERPGPAVHTVRDRLLREYEGHLLAVAGLAESTTRYRVIHARNLLQYFKVRRSSQFKSWLATEVADYVARTGQKWKAGSGQQLSSSIRSFLRFLRFKGLVRRDLSPTIPSFANWRLAPLPAVVDRTDLEKLLSAVDATTPIGMCDRGALLCTIELGLRASEVAAITTDGVDLPGNVLRLHHAKERRVAERPTTRRLVLALREYLRRGRPRSDSPELFVIHRAPIGQALKPIGIRDIVVRYAALAGLAASIRGTHVYVVSAFQINLSSGACGTPRASATAWCGQWPW